MPMMTTTRRFWRPDLARQQRTQQKETTRNKTMSSPQPLLLLLFLSHFFLSANAFTIIIPHTPTTRPLLNIMFMSDSNANDSESMEAIRSLVDFHDGSWKGKATSFSVTADTAAGIVNKKVLPKYKTSIKLGLGENGMTMTETFDFNDKISSRSVPLIKSNMDIDSVDGSYSLDISLPDIPSDVVGTEKLLQFGVEHCIAVNDDARVRCLALYGVEGALSRVVVMHEKRIESGIKSAAESTQEDLLAMSGDIDRIIDKIAGQIETKGDHTSSVAKDASEEQVDRLKQAMQASPDEEEATLTLYPMSLLELSSGVWLGDSIVRDCKNVAASPYDTGSGFSAKRTSITSTQDRRDFANWEMGVQKNAWRWIWKLGDSIRQEDEVGKAMGSPMATELAQSLSGILCVNESLSRRIPRDERMVYIDWDNGAYVGFILGPVSIQLPRYLTFDSSSTKKAKPFFTEFCVYQSASAGMNEGDEMTYSETNEENIRLPELCCSKIARVYNFEGKLKQGCTSFFTLRRL